MIQDDYGHPRKKTIMGLDVEGCGKHVFEPALPGTERNWRWSSTSGSMMQSIQKPKNKPRFQRWMPIITPSCAREWCAFSGKGARFLSGCFWSASFFVNWILMHLSSHPNELSSQRDRLRFTWDSEFIANFWNDSNLVSLWMWLWPENLGLIHGVWYQ